MKNRPYFQLLLRPMTALVLLVTVTVGCQPTTEAEKRYMEEKARQREMKDQLNNSLQAGLDEKEVMTFLKESTIESDDEVTVAQWLEDRLKEEPGQIVFPRWKVNRRGESKYEVRFTYKLMTDQQEIVDKGYAWNVDMVMRLVGEPRELTSADLASGRRNYRSLQQRQRDREREFSLE